MATADPQPDSRKVETLTTKPSANLLSPTRVKVFISVVCLCLLIFHLREKPLDPIALGIFALGLLPWLSAFLDVAELPGGMKFQFAKVKQEQIRQAQELEWIKVLIDLVVSEYERIHLRSLASNQPFMANVKSGSTFEWELRHLITLQLVDRHPGRGIRSLFAHAGQVDVKQHLFITERGLAYLKVIAEARSAGVD